MSETDDSLASALVFAASSFDSASLCDSSWASRLRRYDTESFNRAHRLSSLSNRYASSLASSRPPSPISSFARSAGRGSLPLSTWSPGSTTDVSSSPRTASTGLAEYFTRYERDLISVGAAGPVFVRLLRSGRYGDADMLHGLLASLVGSPATSTLPNTSLGAVQHVSSGNETDDPPPSYRSLPPPQYSSQPDMRNHRRSISSASNTRLSSPTSAAWTSSARASSALRSSAPDWNQSPTAGRSGFRWSDMASHDASSASNLSGRGSTPEYDPNGSSLNGSDSAANALEVIHGCDSSISLSGYLRPNRRQTLLQPSSSRSRGVQSSAPAELDGSSVVRYELPMSTSSVCELPDSLVQRPVYIHSSVSDDAPSDRRSRTRWGRFRRAMNKWPSRYGSCRASSVASWRKLLKKRRRLTSRASVSSALSSSNSHA